MLRPRFCWCVWANCPTRPPLALTLSSVLNNNCPVRRRCIARPAPSGKTPGSIPRWSISFHRGGFMSRKSFALVHDLTVVFLVIAAFTLVSSLAASAQQMNSAQGPDRPWLRFAQPGSGSQDDTTIFRSPLAGVNFRAAVTYTTTGYNPYSAAVADLNGDGKLDLVVANQQQSRNLQAGSISAMLGKGNGTFKNPVTYSSGAPSTFGSHVAVGDVNGDGKLDLVVATTGTGCGSGCPPGLVGVLLGNGNGTFKKAKTYKTGGFDAIGWVVIADVNGDKKPDLIVANYCASSCSYPPSAGSVGVLLGKGDGTFLPVKTFPSGGNGTVSVAVADVNKDGKPDILVANCGPLACGPGSPGGNVAVLLGKGNGTFKPAVTYPAENSPFDVVAADVNGDGKLDIVVSNWGTSNGGSNDGAVTILTGKGNGTFSPAKTFPSGGAESPSVAVADVNKDGLLDVVLACVADTLNQSSTGVVSVLINDTKGGLRLK